jgi:hypothetical protein
MKIDQKRLSAAQKKLPKYKGLDCKRSHGGLRYTKSGLCVKCVSDAAKERNQRVRDEMDRLFETPEVQARVVAALAALAGEADE